MNITSLIERKEHVQQKHGAQKSNSEHRRISATIKRALAQNRLSKIKMAVSHLHTKSDQIPAVVHQLNALVGHRSLSFRWLPGEHNESSALLIRNESVGLLVQTDSDSMPKGMMITPNESAPFCSLTPEAALSALSLQARSQTAFTKATNHALEGVTHLQLLLNTFEA